MPGASALRRIAGDIDEIALLTALRADIRRLCSGYGKTTLATFPVSQATLGAYISLEFTIGRISAVCAYPTLLLALHAVSLLSTNERSYLTL